MFSFEFRKIFKNTFTYGTPCVTASSILNNRVQISILCNVCQPFNPYHFLYPAQTSENLRFSDVLRGIEIDQRYEIG